MQASAAASNAPSSRPQISVEDMLDSIVNSLEDNKAEDIVSIDLSGKSSMADHMVIASGRSARQVAALTDYVIKGLKALGHKDIVVQGQEQADWVLLDTGDVLVHLFRPEVRDFYNLDQMWLADTAEGDLPN